MDKPQYSGIGGLIGSIYEAALDRSRWDVFLAGLASTLKSQAALIWAHDFSDSSAQVDASDGGIATVMGIESSALASFTDYYAARNVWVEDPLLHVSGQVVSSEALYPQNQLKRTEYYQDWLRHQDFFHSSAAIVDKHDDRSLNVTLLRSESCGNYSAHELQIIAVLMPHLQAAFALHRRLHRLDALSQTSMGVLEGCPFGVVLLDERGLFLHANQLAHGLINTSGLLELTPRGEIKATYPAQDGVLQRHLYHAVRTGAGSSSGHGATLRLNGLLDKRLDLTITPLPSWSSPFGQRSATAIFISNPQARPGSLVQRLRQLYGMTQAEAKLTDALVSGVTPKEYAEQQQLSLHTVRVQFKAAAAKAGTGRQADLVRIVLTGPAILGWADAAPR